MIASIFVTFYIEIFLQYLILKFITLHKIKNINTNLYYLIYNIDLIIINSILFQLIYRFISTL